MYIKIGNSAVGAYNSFLKVLFLSNDPAKSRKGLSGYMTSGVFFNIPTYHEYISIDGDKCNLRAHASYGRTYDYRIKPEFQIKDRVWYHTTIYILLLVSVMGIIIATPFNAIPLWSPMISIVSIITVYLMMRAYLRYQYEKITNAMILYHERLTMIVEDGTFEDDNTYRPHTLYRKPHYGGNSKCIHNQLKRFGIDPEKSNDY